MKVFISEVKASDLLRCLDVIRQSFKTVADDFGFTYENCPGHTSFITPDVLDAQIVIGDGICTHCMPKRILSAICLFPKKVMIPASFITSLCYRSTDTMVSGSSCLTMQKEAVKSLGGNTIKISIIEESTVLKNWYISNGFVHTGTKKFDHLPFTSGYLEIKL